MKKIFLMHYDPEKLLRLNYDASPCEFGTILSHWISGGSEKLVVFASITLLRPKYNNSSVLVAGGI